MKTLSDYIDSAITTGKVNSLSDMMFSITQKFSDEYQRLYGGANPMKDCRVYYVKFARLSVDSGKLPWVVFRTYDENKDELTYNISTLQGSCCLWYAYPEVELTTTINNSVPKQELTTKEIQKQNKSRITCVKCGTQLVNRMMLNWNVNFCETCGL